MARLKKESERRLKALRKERASRALERRNARKAARREQEGAASCPDLNDNRPKEGGEAGEGEGVGAGGEDSGEEGKEEDEEIREEEEEEEFDPQEAVLLVYVCTHAAEITKVKNVAGAYLVASDTSWQSKGELVKTSISLEVFAEAIAAVQVQATILNDIDNLLAE